MLKDFAKWRKDLEREGFFKPSPAHVAYRFAELAAMFALGTALMCISMTPPRSSSPRAFGARCSWVQHEGGHSSLTGSIGGTSGAFTAGFGLASSGDMWNSCTTSTTPLRKRCDTTWTSTPRGGGLLQYCGRGKPSAQVQRYGCACRRGRSSRSPLVWCCWPGCTSCIRDIARRKNYEEAAWIVAAHVIRTSIIKAVTGYSWITCYGCSCPPCG